MTAIVDPVRFFGIDSGLRTLRVSKTEARTLLAAARILDKAHSLVVDAVGDDHYDYDITDALCLAPEAMRTLATEGLPL